MGNCAKDAGDLRNATEFLDKITQMHRKVRGLEYYILEITSIPVDSFIYSPCKLNRTTHLASVCNVC